MSKLRSTAIGLSLLLYSAAAQAALPPKYQRIQEIKAILDSQAVLKSFPDSEIIEQIRFVGPDRYRVKTKRCTLDVRIVDDPDAPQMQGPRRFLVKPGTVICTPAR